ncbi:MAG: endopeptidase La, partial [Dongiaceae bacterium]
MPEPSKTTLFPVLPLRDIVVFPHISVVLFVGREKSINAIEDVLQDDRRIFLATQVNAAQDDPENKDLYKVGTIAEIVKDTESGRPNIARLPDGTVKVMVRGLQRGRIADFVEHAQFFQAYVEPQPEEENSDAEVTAMVRALIGQFDQYLKLNKKFTHPGEILSALAEMNDPSMIVDTIASHLVLKIAEKQSLLETHGLIARIEKIFGFMEGEIGVLQVEKKIRNRVKRQMEKTQREYYLNEQLKAIQKELGEGEDGRDELSELEARIKKTRLSKEAREKATSELKKLKSMSPMSAEATVVRNYLDWILSIPWRKTTRIKTDIVEAGKVLDRDHFGLEKVKERILEHLAVQVRTKKMRGPILCLVGPPGVGKTSLGKSLAEATGRNFVRVSLGGVRDEAEIRGHRRTYIGSMPGKLIQAMKKAKSSNPLFMLDEIDKMASDWRGDPAAALLEVLDPEQNSNFNDHYLEVDYDLSDVMFITTANTLRMPQPLLDRMEIIRLAGYTEEEKLEIAKRHLLPKVVKAHGVKNEEFKVSDAAIIDVIRYYTREAGVRNLERELATLARKAIKEISVRKIDRVSVTPKSLEKFLGVRKFRYGEAELEDAVGVTTGLA